MTGRRPNGDLMYEVGGSPSAAELAAIIVCLSRFDSPPVDALPPAWKVAALREGVGEPLASSPMHMPRASR